MSSKRDTASSVSRATTSELAPAWHTALLIALFLAVAIAGAWLSLRAPQTAPVPTTAPTTREKLLGIYAPMVVVQWSLFAYVIAIGRPKGSARRVLAALVGRGWSTTSRAFGDLGLAAIVWCAITALAIARAWSTHTPPSVASVAPMLPGNAIEKVAWAIVSVSAGCCEEVVFRGYLQRQLTSWTGRVWLAIALQAALFGVTHGNQGLVSAAMIAMDGALLGIVSHARRSLVPAVISHVWTDLASGLGR